MVSLSHSPFNQRARQVLVAIVKEYLETGDAVGSVTLTQRHRIDLSPATIRSVMGDLEELGFLHQPHPSAGRLPTEQGLRFFVNSLLQVHHLSVKERETWAQHYSLSKLELDIALKEASKILSELSHHTVVLIAPKIETDVLSHIEFIRLPSQDLLAVLVNKSGKIYNRVVSFSALSPEELDRIHQYLNHRMKGKTLAEIRALVSKDLSNTQIEYDQLAKQALMLQAQALPEQQTQVIIQGQANLLGSVFEENTGKDLKYLKALFQALDDKKTLLKLLESTESAQGIQVFIGAESSIPELSAHTLVTTSYGHDQAAVGVLGVIGPTRMNYPRILSLVDFTAQLLSSMMKTS